MRDVLAVLGGILMIFATLIWPISALVDTIVSSGDNHLFFVLFLYMIWWWFACVKIGHTLEDEGKKT